MTSAHPFPDSDSITAPMLIGTSADDAWAPTVVNTLVSTVPAVALFRNVSVGRKTFSKPFTRSIWQSSEPEGYYRVLKCYDVADEDEYRPFSLVHWELGIRLLEPAPYAEVLPAENTVVRADVISYELKGGAVTAAAQLALVRHLLVESYRALDPTITVVGGQRGWRSEWWPDVAATA